MSIEVVQGILIPFAGTSLGAACVFFMQRTLRPIVQRALTGFAAGVMVAASIWSLLIPAMEQSAPMGKLSFLPAVAGFWIGVLFLLVLDRIIPHLHMGSSEAEGPSVSLKRTTMLVFAVVLHNIPEGMAVGLSFARAAQHTGNAGLFAAAGALAIGIGIQNFPEGAAVALPLHQEGLSRTRSFVYGSLSGIVEPIFGVLVVLCASALTPFMPWLLSAAAGAMLYVVVEELIPEAHLGEHSHPGTLGVMAGFLVMMVLDTALG